MLKSPDLFPQVVVSIRDSKAVFAKWAIAQSPYTVPDRLSEVLDDLRNLLRLAPGYGSIGDFEFVQMPRSDLRLWLEAFIDNSAIVKSWNSPKNPSNCEYRFVSRFDAPIAPDDDFIDVSALCQNVVAELIRTDAEIN